MTAERAPHVRHGVGEVRPYIHGPADLPEFLQETFAAEEVERHEFDADSAHVELRIGDAVVVVEAGELPPDVAPWTSSIYVYVTDVDAVYQRAMELGAQSFEEPQDRPYDERQAAFRDAAGNTWWVATYQPQQD